jgi:hypothetical protein
VPAIKKHDENAVINGTATEISLVDFFIIDYLNSMNTVNGIIPPDVACDEFTQKPCISSC